MVNGEQVIRRTNHVPADHSDHLVRALEGNAVNLGPINDPLNDLGSSRVLDASRRAVCLRGLDSD